MLTDYQGNKVTQVYYKPYGKTYDLIGEDIFRYKFTAQEEDNTTGLYYYNARFYDPAIGRFLSPDTMIPDPTGTQDYNRYMYVKGNPMKYNDPSGHYPDEWWYNYYNWYYSSYENGNDPSDDYSSSSYSYGYNNGNGGNVLAAILSPLSLLAALGNLAKEAYELNLQANEDESAVPPATPSSYSSYGYYPSGGGSNRGASTIHEAMVNSVNNSSVQPSYFTQGQFNTVNRQFGITGCAAISLLNELSEEYTEQTDTQLTLSQAVIMLNKAVKGGSIDSTQGLFVYWEKAANQMWGTLGLSGRWIYDANRLDHVIYDIIYYRNYRLRHHFVSSYGQNQYFNVANGLISNVSALLLRLNPAWPIRNLRYLP